MPELKEYVIKVGDVETTMQLSKEDADRYGEAASLKSRDAQNKSRDAQNK